MYRNNLNHRCIPEITLEWDKKTQVIDPLNGTSDNLFDARSWVYEHTGTIRIPRGTKQLSSIGAFRVYYINLTQGKGKPAKLKTLLTEHSSRLEKYNRSLRGDKSRQLSKTIDDIFGQCVEGTNLLIIDRVELANKWMGNGIGESVLRVLMERLGSGCGVIATHKVPTQFDENSNRCPVKYFSKFPNYNSIGGFIVMEKSGEIQITQKIEDKLKDIGFHSLPNSRVLVTPGPALRYSYAIRCGFSSANAKE